MVERIEGGNKSVPVKSGALDELVRVAKELFTRRIVRRTEAPDKKTETIRREQARQGYAAFRDMCRHLTENPMRRSQMVEGRLREYVKLGRGTLRISIEDHRSVAPPGYRPPTPLPVDRFLQSGWDVLLTARVVVTQNEPAYAWSSWLMFTDAGKKEGYRWWEVSFFDAARRGYFNQPFSPQSNELAEADKAIKGRMPSAFGIAEGPRPIDGENQAAFCDRWWHRLALAAKGELQQPREFPVKE